MQQCRTRRMCLVMQFGCSAQAYPFCYLILNLHLVPVLRHTACRSPEQYLFLHKDSRGNLGHLHCHPPTSGLPKIWPNAHIVLHDRVSCWEWRWHLNHANYLAIAIAASRQLRVRHTCCGAVVLAQRPGCRPVACPRAQACSRLQATVIAQADIRKVIQHLQAAEALADCWPVF